MLQRNPNAITSILFPLGLWLCIGIFAAETAQAQRNVVVVRPKEIHDVLVNPGMGITTFQRFNGQEPNPPLKWSEAGPVAKLPQAAAHPDFPDTSVSYCRWYWNVLESEPGKFDWSIVDLAIEEARTHGQKLAIRLMPYSNEDPLPEWFRKSGARRANKDSDKDGKIWQPDFSDPLYLKYWSELVAEAGKRYDGNPYLDSVDISSVGYWGEGWSPYMPAFPFQKALIDIWLDAFKRTPLLMNFDEPEALAYGTQHGAGWRLDCWGDMRVSSTDPYFPAEMLEIYPQQIVRTGIQDVWQKSPVSLETCYTVPGWKERGYDVDYILAQGVRWHVSTVNIKSSPIPAEWKAKFEEFQKKIGYRFILRRLEYSKVVKHGTMMPVHLWWLNDGIAPVYNAYDLMLELRSRQESARILIPVDVRKWLPGDAVFDGSVYIPEDLAEGNYDVRVAMLDPRTGVPAIRFAIEGRQDDGWYAMGSLTVTNSEPLQ
ncbi:MAG: DUF4832 domain-containing protein [Acidobacteria bacterium]|nr:DUF4832 domain-containing protein [Acidobacteriota bacterium]MBS1866687.1 DUF4832 domain-containing protein [Acidobacteriota bacterium]